MMRWAREAVIGWQRGKRKTVNSRKGGNVPLAVFRLSRPADRAALPDRRNAKRRFESAIG